MTQSTYLANKALFDSHLEELAVAGGTGYYDPVHDCYRIVHLSAMVHLGLVQRLESGEREAYTITKMGREAIGFDTQWPDDFSETALSVFTGSTSVVSIS